MEMPGKLVQGKGEFKDRSPECVDLGHCEPPGFTLGFNLGDFLKVKLICRVPQVFSSIVVYKQPNHPC